MSGFHWLPKEKLLCTTALIKGLQHTPSLYGISTWQFKPALTFDLQEGKGVMIIDAGGGTLDFSSYAQNDQDMMEIAASQCKFAILVLVDNSYEKLGIYNGSVFVTTRAKSFFKGMII